MRASFDAAVLVRALERPASDEARLLDAVIAGRLEAAVAEEDLDTVERFFRHARGRAFASRYTELIRRVAIVAPTPYGVDAAVTPRPGAQGVTKPALYTRRDFTRCVMIALLVGTALVGINVRPTSESGVIVAGPDPFRIALNYLVPFLVATASAVLANRARLRPRRA